MTDVECQWFLHCHNPATHLQNHPALDPVPTCDRCAEKFGLPRRRPIIDTLTIAATVVAWLLTEAEASPDQVDTVTFTYQISPHLFDDLYDCAITSAEIQGDQPS